MRQSYRCEWKRKPLSSFGSLIMCDGWWMWMKMSGVGAVRWTTTFITENMNIIWSPYSFSSLIFDGQFDFFNVIASKCLSILVFHPDEMDFDRKTNGSILIFNAARRKNVCCWPVSHVFRWWRRQETMWCWTKRLPHQETRCSLHK